MRLRLILALCLCFAAAVFAQTSAGTITGTITDPAGAVVANASIEAKNSGTGVAYPAGTSTTGNYTIGQLPYGTYELTVTVAGFKRFVRPGLIIQAAQTIRVDTTLEVGNASESVTINAEAPMLKTESGEISQTIAAERMDDLPLLVLGTNTSGIRNPYNIAALLPGSYYAPPVQAGVGSTVRINGGVTASETLLVEGMDATNALGQGANQQNQPGMDQIQEWTVQTSNYAAEFGQAGSAVMNVVMKSGTNGFHGSGYNYFQNEALNAGQPFTDDGSGHHIRPKVRRNDYGGTFGGPVWIPKVYNGRNKSFFFFSWEQFIQNQLALPGVINVPTAAYRSGDFSAAIAAAGNRNIATDPLGRPIIANTIYDPLTRRTAPNGQIVTDAFVGNKINPARLDPVALKVQNLIPLPFCVPGAAINCNVNGVINNFQNTELQQRDTEAPSLKIDHVIGPKDKLSFFWNRTMTYCLTCYGADGLPQPIGGTFGGAIYAKALRLNYDHTVTPTVLMHLGVGYNDDDLGRPSVTPDYDACGQIGLCSGAFTRPGTFPSFTGLNDTTAGGATTVGPPGRGDSIFGQFNSIASLTWVKSNHTFKFGGELRNQGNYAVNWTNLQGTYGFTNGQTAMPYAVVTSGGPSTANIGANHIGMPYAGFVLGAVDIANINPPSNSRFGKHQLGFYGQDSWKVTRKLTLDLGLRYDYSSYYKEQYGRSPQLAPLLPNPTAGGHPGAVTYQATCNCEYARNYPWGFGPRFGFAYQFLPKTVFRGGFGIVYTGTGVATTFGGAYGSSTASNPFGPSSTPGLPVMSLGNGVTVNGAPLTRSQILWPNFSSGYYPINGVIPGAGPQYYDPNGGRPARQYQWSIGIQREVIRNLVVEANYVGNRGIWWPSSTVGSSLISLNYLTTGLLNQYGLNLSNPADLATLLAAVGSPAAGRFQNKLPFSGFPLTQTVAQSLRPFPQFSSGLTVLSAPLADSWYNSLQISANLRMSHGLQLTYGLTWSKSMDTFNGSPDVQNLSLAKKISSLDQPLAMRVGYNYTTPKWGPKLVSHVVGDWLFNGFLYYASGIPLAIPAANTTGYAANIPTTATMSNLTFQPAANPQNRVSGQGVFLQDLNCHCFDPNTSFVLNPAAWANPAPGQFGSSTFYGDYRGQRRPVENLAVGRRFLLRSDRRVELNLRAEFQNIFNRVYLSNPSVTSPQTPSVCRLPGGSNGACSQPGLQVVSGFGSINTSTTPYPNRFGQLVAQIRF